MLSLHLHAPLTLYRQAWATAMAVEWSLGEIPPAAFEAIYPDRDEAAAQHRIYLARIAAAREAKR